MYFRGSIHSGGVINSFRSILSSIKKGENVESRNSRCFDQWQGEIQDRQKEEIRWYSMLEVDYLVFSWVIFVKIYPQIIIYLNVFWIYMWIYVCTFIVHTAWNRSTGFILDGRPFLGRMHNEHAHMYITYIYSNTSLLVIFYQSTGLRTEAIFSNRHPISSMVMILSLG